MNYMCLLCRTEVGIKLLILIFSDTLLQGSSVSAKSTDPFKSKNHSWFANGASSRNHRLLGMPVEDIAATKIQTAFRAYMVCWVTNCFLFYIGKLQLDTRPKVTLRHSHGSKKNTTRAHWPCHVTKFANKSPK